MKTALLSDELQVTSYKLFSVLLFSIFTLLFVFPVSVFAQSPATVSAQTTLPVQSSNQNYQPLPAYISPQSPIYANKMILNLMHGLSCILTGQSIVEPCIEYQITKNLQGKIQTLPVLSSVNTSGGLLGSANSILAGIYTNPPLHLSEPVNALKEQFGFTSTAHAQVAGSGNQVLSPIFKLWEVSRNVAYLVMILIFITIGIMVMFRYKLNPQTVVSVQLALPGLVIGLALITFSYFFAAFITDFAFIGTDLVGYYFQAATSKDNGSLSDHLKDKNFVSIGSSFAGRLGVGEISPMADILIDNLESFPKDKGAGVIVNAQNIVRLSIATAAYPVGSAVGKTVGGAVETFWPALRTSGLITKFRPITTGTEEAAAKELGAFLTAPSGAVLGLALALAAYLNPGYAIGWAFYLIGIFAVLYAVFRLLLALINSYLSIIFLTITAPFHFLIGALPGRQTSGIDWSRNLLSNVLAFPAVIAAFYFAAYLLGGDKIQAFGLQDSLQITGNQGTLPLFGGLDISFIRVLLAFGAVMATPKIPEIIGKAIGKPGVMGGLFDQAVNQAVGQGQKYSGQLTQGAGRVQGDVKESWTKWRGQDPYSSQAEKVNFARLQKGKGPIQGVFAPVIPSHELRSTEGKIRALQESNIARNNAAMAVQARDEGRIVMDDLRYAQLKRVATGEPTEIGNQNDSGLLANQPPPVPPTPGTGE